VILRESFPAQVALVLIIGALLLGYPLAAWASRATVVGVIAGAALSTLNVLLGYASIRYAFDKSYTTFLKAVLGGMGLRMVIMLGGLAGLIVGAGMEPVSLASSLLGFYAVYLIIEIMFIQRKVSVKNQG
jgi:hypothetical protein